MRIEYHEVDEQSAAAQVVVRLQQVAEQAELTAVVDAGQNDRQVAGDPVLPQFRLTAPVHLHGIGVAQARVGEQQPPREPLIAQRVLNRQSEVAHLDLRVGAGQRDRARDRAAVVILLDSWRAAPSVSANAVVKASRAVPPGAGGRLAQADDRIEHRAGGVRQPCAALQRRGVGDRSAAPDEARAVGFVLGRGADLAASAEHVHEIHAIAARARPAGAHQRVRFRQGARFDEEIAEGWMRQVGVLRCKDDLGVARQLQAAGVMAVIGDRDASQLGVVLGRDDDFGAGFEAAVDAAPDRAIERERRFVFVRLAAAGLVRGRPDLAGIEIADEDETAPVDRW